MVPLNDAALAVAAGVRGINAAALARTQENPFDIDVAALPLTDKS